MPVSGLQNDNSPRGRITGKTVLRLGFAAMIALLIASAAETYRSQVRTARQTERIYHEYVRQQEALYRLRRVLYLGGIHARDLFLSRQPDRVDRYRRELAALTEEARGAVDGLEQSLVHHTEAGDLRSLVDDYLTLLASIESWPGTGREREASRFIQGELVPRRNTAGEVARNWLRLSQQALETSDEEFEKSREAAAQRLFVILATCILLGLAVARFSLRHAEQLERQTSSHFQAVERAKEELQQLSARLLEIQEEERKNLSRELHDEIGQTLTALRIDIVHAASTIGQRPEAARERLERARELAERTVRTVRDISILLRPPLLDDLGLSPALQSLAEEFSRRTGTPCDFSEEGLDESLPDSAKTCVYRVVQEALNNIQKHSSATRASIAVRQKQSGLTVEVHDNGRGFPVSRVNGEAYGRLGVLGMRERATMLGGTVTFDSEAGGGTTVALHVPLQPAATQKKVQEAHA